MVKTIAQALIEKGEKIGKIRAKRDTLIMVLRERFKVSQEDIIKEVMSINQIEEFDKLIKRAATASTFESVGINKK